MKSAFELSIFDDVTLKGFEYIPTGSVKKAVILVHGMAETIARYEEFAKFLCNKGVAVVGYDQRGHGQTAGDIQKLGIIGEDGWQKMKFELREIVDQTQNKFPDIPLYVFGHSMGSFITRDFILEDIHKLNGVILSGVGFQPKLLLQSGKAISTWVQAIKGPEFRSKFIHELTFGTYNKKYKNVLTSFDWLTSDPIEVQKFMDDPYCGAMHPVGFFSEMSENLERLMYRDYFKVPVNQIPMMIISGDQDPVGQYGKALKTCAKVYRNAGFAVEEKCYQNGRHEMLNEINKHEVYQDVYNWLERH